MKECPYCESAGGFLFKIHGRIYDRCRGCNLIYKRNQKDYAKVLAKYQNENYFSSYSCGQTDRKRDKLYKHLLDFIEGKKRTGSLLDVGAGCGFFLKAAQKQKWKVKGVEPSRQSVILATMQNDLDMFVGTLQEFVCSDRFDLITFINVLDHSAEPWEEIKRANALLKPDGILYLRFPNGALHTWLYLLASKYGYDDHIQKYLVFHEYSFTPKFIQRLLSDIGLSDIRIFNSLMTEGDSHNLFPSPNIAKHLKKTIYLIATVLQILTKRKVLLGTSLEVWATKRHVSGIH